MIFIKFYKKDRAKPKKDFFLLLFKSEKAPTIGESIIIINDADELMRKTIAAGLSGIHKKVVFPSCPLLNFAKSRTTGTMTIKNTIKNGPRAAENLNNMKKRKLNK